MSTAYTQDMAIGIGIVQLQEAMAAESFRRYEEEPVGSFEEIAGIAASASSAGGAEEISSQVSPQGNTWTEERESSVGGAEHLELLGSQGK